MNDDRDPTSAARRAECGDWPQDDLVIDRCDDRTDAGSRRAPSQSAAGGAQAQSIASAECSGTLHLPTIGVLLSGGLDSCVLVGRLCEIGFPVQPFYIRCGLAWEEAELHSVVRFLNALCGGYTAASAASRSTGVPAGASEPHRAFFTWRALSHKIAPLVVFDQPVDDLYGGHWSRTGVGVPDASSADEAVFLPGRNALLLVKPALWCAQRGISQIALAVLKGNPFSDATEEFFAGFARALSLAVGVPLRFLRPCAHLDKTALIRLGRTLPLELSFSCIAPVANRHCGRCNKCAERRNAFLAAGITDLTEYACGP